MAELQSMFERCQQSYVLVLLDLDRFKELNDVHGHAAGDAVLGMVGRVLSEACRPSDHVSRFGGEEFALIVPQCSRDEGRALADRCRGRLEAARLNLAGQMLHVTMSGGLAVIAEMETSGGLIGPLYAARLHGPDDKSNHGHRDPCRAGVRCRHGRTA